MEEINFPAYRLNEQELLWLKSQMQLRGYSYRRLAKELDISPSYLSDLLNGRNYFSKRMINKFLDLKFMFTSFKKSKLTEEQVNQVYSHLIKDRNWSKMKKCCKFRGECVALKELLYELTEEKQKVR